MRWSVFKFRLVTFLYATNRTDNQYSIRAVQLNLALIAISDHLIRFFPVSFGALARGVMVPNGVCTSETGSVQ